MSIYTFVFLTALVNSIELKSYTKNFEVLNPETLDISNFLNQYYYIDISIGNPLQNFTVLVDLSSPFTWVSDLACVDCEDADNFYNSTASTTDLRSGLYYSLNSSRYNMTGEAVSESVRISELTQATDCQIISALNVSHFKKVHNDGVLGLAPGNYTSEGF